MSKEAGAVMPVYLKAESPAIFDGSVKRINMAESAPQQKGHDSTIFKNVKDPILGDHYIVYEPTQIKSATDNIGTFDASDPDIRHSVRQKADASRSAAVNLVHRVIKGENITRAKFAKELEQTGLTDKADEILRMAGDIREDVEETVSQFQNDEDILNEIRKSEIRRYYQNKIQEVYDKGIEEGEVAEQARKVISDRKKAAKTREVAARTGMTIKDLKEDHDIDIVELMAKDKFNGAVLVEQVGNIVRNELIKEGKLSAKKKVFKNDPIYRRELRQTLAKTLREAAKQLTHGMTRQSATNRINAMEQVNRTGVIEERSREIAAYINEGRVKDSVTEKRAEFNKIFKRGIIKSKEKSTAELRKKKIDPKVKKWVNLVKQVAAMGEKTAKGLEQEMIDLINAGKSDNDLKAAKRFEELEETYTALKKYRHLTVTEKALLMNSVLNTYGALNSRTPAQIQTMIDGLNAELAKGVAVIENIIKERKARLEPIKELFKEAISPEGSKKVQGARETAEALARSNYGLRSWFRILPKASTGALNKKATQALTELLNLANDASQAEDIAIMHTHNSLIDAIQRIYKEDPGKVLDRLTKPRKELKKLSNKENNLSILQVLQLYSMATQEDYASNAAHPKNNRDAKKLRAALSDKEIELLNWFRSHYREKRAPLSAMNEEMTGNPIDMEDPNYTPGAVDTGEGGFNEMHESQSIVPKAQNPRVDHTHDFSEEVDILDIFIKRTQENEHYLAWAKLSSDLRGIFGNSEVQDALVRALGKKSKTKFINMLQDNINGGYDSAYKSESVDSVRALFTFSKFFLNARIGLKQPTSFPAFAFEIGLKDTGKHTATWATPEGFAAMKEILNSEQTKERLGKGQTEELRNAMKTMTPSKVGKLMRASMIANKVGDITPTLVVGQGIYRSLVNEYNESGMPLDESEVKSQGLPEGSDTAKDRAMRRLFEIVEATQQSGKLKDQSEWQRRGGSWFKVLAQFTNTQRQFLEQEMVALEQLLANPKEGARWANAVEKIVINHVLLPMLYNAMNMFINALMGDAPDEDDAWLMAASMLSGPASGFVVFGALATSFIEGLIQGGFGFGSQLTPFAGILDDSKTMGAVVHAMLSADTDKVIEAVDKLGKSYVPPYREVRKVIDNN